MKHQRQKGSIVHIGQRWFVRYSVERLGPDGKLSDRKLSAALGPWNGTDKVPPQAILDKRDEFMSNLRTYQPMADKAVSFEYFVTKVFLPEIQRNKKPSTFHTYHSLWLSRVAPYVAGVQLASVDVEFAQQLLDRITDDRVAQGHPLSVNTAKMIRGFLSSCFKEARRRGFFKQSNPLTDTRIDPRCIPPKETAFYTVEDVRTIARLLDFYANDAGLAATIFLTGVCHSLRVGELEALDWANLHDGELHIEQNVTFGKIGTPKSKASRASVPVIRQVAERLEFHRERMRAQGWPVEGDHPMFINPIGGRLRLESLLDGTIRPVLDRCRVCGRRPGKGHLKGWQQFGEHDWTRAHPVWSGWHSGRRGTATLLGALGVNDKIIQRILRHSNLATTMAFYRKPTSQEVESAMEQLGRAYFEEPPLPLSTDLDTKSLELVDPIKIN